MRLRYGLSIVISENDEDVGRPLRLKHPTHSSNVSDIVSCHHKTVGMHGDAPPICKNGDVLL